MSSFLSLSLAHAQGIGQHFKHQAGRLLLPLATTSATTHPQLLKLPQTLEMTSKTRELHRSPQETVFQSHLC